MEHFIDMLLNRDFDLRDEILALEELFQKKHHNVSAFDKFDRNFLNWQHRSNYISVRAFHSGTGLFRILNRCSQRSKISLDEYILYCEYMLNVISFAPVAECLNIRYIRENINNVLEKLNYEILSDMGKTHIVEKNVLVSEAADIVKDNYDLGEGIYSFNYRESKGNIAHKADILCRLYKYIENIENKAKSYNFSELLEDIKALANKLDIRHAATAKQSDVINNMSKDEYESLLDELFNLSLSLIILVDYKNKRKDIKALKAQLG